MVELPPGQWPRRREAENDVRLLILPSTVDPSPPCASFHQTKLSLRSNYRNFLRGSTLVALVLPWHCIRPSSWSSFLQNGLCCCCLFTSSVRLTPWWSFLVRVEPESLLEWPVTVGRSTLSSNDVHRELQVCRVLRCSQPKKSSHETSKGQCSCCRSTWIGCSSTTWGRHNWNRDERILHKRCLHFDNIVLWFTHKQPIVSTSLTITLPPIYARGRYGVSLNWIW